MMPWGILGAKTYAADMRVVSDQANDSQEGIGLPPDFKVSTVPGAMRVQAVSGVYTIKCRTRGFERQSYTGYFPGGSVPVSPTGAGESRSDMVMLRIEDPETGAWDAPPDPVNGPYAHLHVEPGVDAAAETVPGLGQGYTAIPLKRFDLGPDTAVDLVGTPSTDLRFLAKATPFQVMESYSLVTGDDYDELTSTSWVTFPADVGEWRVRVPEHVTHLKLSATWAQLGNKTGGNEHANFRFRLGSTASQAVRYNSVDTSGGYRSTLVCADTIPVSESMRGTTQTLSMQAQKVSGDDAVTASAVTALLVQGWFALEPE